MYTVSGLWYGSYPLRNWVTSWGAPRWQVRTAVKVSHGYLYFLVGDIPSFGQWGYTGDEVGHPVIFFGNIPSGYVKIAIEHGQRNSFDLPIKNVDFP